MSPADSSSDVLKLGALSAALCGANLAPPCLMAAVPTGNSEDRGVNTSVQLLLPAGHSEDLCLSLGSPVSYETLQVGENLRALHSQEACGVKGVHRGASDTHCPEPESEGFCRCPSMEICG